MAGPVITIARQLGSGGDEVAALVAEQLGIPLLDQEIISQAAREAGVSESAMRASERASSLFSRMLESLGKFGAAGGEAAALEGFTSTQLLSTSADFRALLERVLRGMAERGPGVIVGHAGQVTLRDVPGTLHVFIHAPLDYRVAHHARQRSLPAKQAQKEVEESDRERVRFFRTAYSVDWYDLRLYDLVADTSLLSIHGAADMIARMAAEACTTAPETVATPPTPLPAPPPARPDATLEREHLRVRPMSPTDAGALLSLFRSLEPRDLLFLRKDVTNERVLDAWARDVADGRIVTLLAETPDGQVVGEASMYPSEVPWTQHVAEVRVVTSPAMRGHGLGRMLLQEILQSAQAAGVEKLTAQMIVEQTSARRLFEGLGFREEGRYRNYARDQQGNPHDLLVMTYDALPEPDAAAAAAREIAR